MSTAMIHAPIVVLELLAVVQVFRFWGTLGRLGYFDTFVRLFYTAFLADCVLISAVVFQLALAFHDWAGLPLAAIGIRNTAAAVLTWVTFGFFLGMVWMFCRGRLDHDSAHRAIAALKYMGGSNSRIEL